MLTFDYKALPWNVIFGAGALKRLPDEINKLGLQRALILVTPNQVEQGREIEVLLGSLAAGLFDQAVMHVPGETVAQAIATAKELNADCTVSLGGGSTTGLGKALALKLDLPNIVIPTTYAGSEMTNIWGITENERKVTGRDNIVLPTLTLYDPELTMSLPVHIAGPSGINAMAQAAVNATAPNANPFVAMMALEAVKTLAASLPQVVANPDDVEARSQALLGACLAGGALGTGVTSLHHRLCHTLGGSFNTPHAETHTVLLPHSIAYNAAAVPQPTQRLAEALGVSDAARGIYQLARTVGAPVSLKEIGFKEHDIDKAADLVVEKPLNNPEPVTREGVHRLLVAAYEGREP